jgi:hypothetical protein
MRTSNIDAAGGVAITVWAGFAAVVGFAGATGAAGAGLEVDLAALIVGVLDTGAGSPAATETLRGVRCR